MDPRNQDDLICSCYLEDSCSASLQLVLGGPFPGPVSRASLSTVSTRSQASRLQQLAAAHSLPFSHVLTEVSGQRHFLWLVAGRTNTLLSVPVWPGVSMDSRVVTPGRDLSKHGQVRAWWTHSVETHGEHTEGTPTAPHFRSWDGLRKVCRGQSLP